MHPTPEALVRRAWCVYCGTVYLFTADLDRLLLEVEVAGPRCDVCDPGSARGPDGGGPAVERFDVVWAGTGAAFEGLDLVDTRRPAAKPERCTGAGPVRDAPEDPADGPGAFGDAAWTALAGAWKPEHCLVLVAAADALDEVRERIRDGVATGVRVTLRWACAPPIVAALAGELVARAAPAHLRTPLPGLVALLRAAAAAICAGTGNAASCHGAANGLDLGPANGATDGWIGLAAAHERLLAGQAPELPRRIPAAAAANGPGARVPARIRSSWLFHDCPADGAAVWRRGTCNVVQRDGEERFTGDLDVIPPGTEAALMVEQVATPSGGAALVGWATYRTVDGNRTEMRIVLTQEGFEDPELDELWRRNALAH